MINNIVVSILIVYTVCVISKVAITTTNKTLSNLIHQTFGSKLYARFFWPYFLSFFKLAFLSYKEAGQEVNLKKDQKVLLIGAGPIPYHIQWKKVLGSKGSITVLDIDKLVTKQSLIVECIFEKIQKLLGNCYVVSKHICADAKNIPLSENSFDVVIAIRSYYVNVDEALRVLKPEGKIVIKFCGEVILTKKSVNKRKINGGWIITLRR